MSATALAPVFPAPPLPPPLTSFVGREREVAAVSDVLATARLVTLTGAGGSGKTRLATEVARAVAPRFAGGVVWIELGAITDPARVAGHIVTGLGIEAGGRPPGEALHAALGQAALAGELLIVLDNCEHVIEPCAFVVDDILRCCSHARVLATSREALGVTGERAWLVPVLALPRPDASFEEIAGAEAVRLFVDRAQAASASFALTAGNAAAVGALCRRLDGLPLAIELAAARVRAFTPEQMLGRLDDSLRLLASNRRGVVARHRTLREAIDWSYDLLDQPERTVLQRLSIFAGEFSLEAAEAVCAHGAVARDAVIDHLAALVDKSLIVVRDQVDEARYHLLETIRQYARERLDETPDASPTSERHAAFYATLVRGVEPHFITARRRQAVERVQRELDDVRLALAWTREHDGALHVELAGRLGWFWYSSGLWTEGRRWLTEALGLPEAGARDAKRAAVLFAVGVIASLQGDGPIARAWLEESAELARALGDRRLEAYAQSYIGVALGQDGLMAAEAPTRAALAWFEEAGDLYGRRLALVVLVTLRLREGDLPVARAMAEEAVQFARAYGLGRELGIALQILGTVQLHQRELESAAHTIGEALRALRDDPQAFWLARCMELLGIVACVRGRPAEAVRLFGSAAARRERMGATMFRLDRDRLAPYVAGAREALGEAPFAEAWAAARALPFEDVVDAAIVGAGVPVVPNVAQPVIASPLPAASSAPLPAPSGAEPPVALRVLTLGPVEIQRDGVILPPGVWKYARPRELFLYLLAHPEGRTREQVGLAFWPDASAAQVKNNFHVMLHHLRRALGRSDLVLFEGERYRVNWSVGVEVDAATFKREATAAQRGLRANPGSAEAADRLRAALALYRGDFLEGEGAGDWHLELRDHLHRVRVESLDALGTYLMDQEAYADAAGVYRMLVQTDELNEEAHRSLMAALARSGQRGEALRHYDRFATLLRADLDAAPERQTTLLYDKLRRAEAV